MKGLDRSVRRVHVSRSTRHPAPNFPMRPRIAAMAALCLLLPGLAATAGADDPPEILDILNQFAATDAAATLCMDVDEEQLAGFALNLQIVHARARMAQQERFPEASNEQIAGGLRHGWEEVRSRVEQHVDQHGCDDPHIRTLTELFAVQAEWTPFEAPGEDADQGSAE